MSAIEYLLDRESIEIRHTNIEYEIELTNIYLLPDRRHLTTPTSLIDKIYQSTHDY